MENPTTDKEQNSEVTSASMHDIPLSNDEHEEQTPGSIEKIPSKSSSLKRFFKLSSSKKSITDGGNDKSLEDGGAEADNEEGNEEVPSKTEQNIDSTESQEPSKENAEDIRRSRSRRFNFRFHGSTAENDTPTSSGQVPNTSRHSLRGSLSTYFNSVFKRKQSASSKHTLRSTKKRETKNEEESDPSKEVVQEKVSEDIEIHDPESQTVEIVDELQTMTVSEQNNESSSAIPLPPVQPKVVPTHTNYPYN